MTSRQDLVDALLRENPFDSNRVSPASSQWADAPQIHAEAFARLQHGADQVFRNRSSRGILLWSEPGIGKSHLLARLQHWADAEPQVALFLPVANLQAEPERLPRALLRSVLDLLTLGLAQGSSRVPLFRLANGMVRKAVDGTSNVSIGTIERRCRRMIDRWCQESPAKGAVLDRTIFDLLLRFFQSHSQRVKQGVDDGIAGCCVHYLRGDGIDREDAARLGLNPQSEQQSVGLADDEQVKKVFVALSKAAWCWGRPMILALDQVDNLEPAQFHTLGRFLHALLDSASNLLVITSGVRETLLRWREERILQQSSWDRIAQEEIELQRLSRAECAPILSARLQSFGQSFIQADDTASFWRHDALFPLGESWLVDRLDGRIDIRPRDLLHWARLAWEEQQRKATEQGITWLNEWRALTPPPLLPGKLTPLQILQRIDQTVRQRLELLQEKKKRDLEVRDWNPDGLADCVAELTKLCVKRSGWPYLQAVERISLKGVERPTLHMVLQHRLSATGPDVKLGVACLPASTGTDLTTQLKRILGFDPSPDRLILVYDQRSGFKPARKGQEYRGELSSQYGDEMREVSLDLTEQARLYAMSGVLRDAASRELEVVLSADDVRTLTRSEVFESLVRQDFYVTTPLLNALLRLESNVPSQEVLAEA